jgi:hypothetical protein
VVGSCFFFDTPPNGQHLFVVLAPSLDEADSFICVNIETRRVSSDPTCLVNRGEHPNLTNEVSAVVYQFARDLPRRLIERLQREQQLQNVSPQLLRRIQTAPLTDESRLRNKYKQAIKTHLGLT